MSETERGDPDAGGSRSVAPLTSGLVGVLAAILLGTALLLWGNGPTKIDSWWHDLMLSLRTGFGVSVARVFDIVGGVTPMIFIGVVIVAAFLIARRPWSALTVVVAMVLCEAVTGVLKVLLARPRPEDSLADVALTSFPSGHTSLAAAFAVVLALLIGRFAWIVAGVWVALMAWSRTYLEAHWLSDVIGGAVLGSAIALLSWWLVTALRDSVKQRHSAPLHP